MECRNISCMYTNFKNRHVTHIFPSFDLWPAHEQHRICRETKVPFAASCVCYWGVTSGLTKLVCSIFVSGHKCIYICSGRSYRITHTFSQFVYWSDVSYHFFFDISVCSLWAIIGADIGRSLTSWVGFAGFVLILSVTQGGTCNVDTGGR